MVATGEEYARRREDERTLSLARTGTLYSPDPFCKYFKQATLEFLFNAGKWTNGSNIKIGEDINNE